MAENEPLLWGTLGVMLLGLLGSVLPGLPGVSIIFAAGLVYAYQTDFSVVGAGILTLMGCFALISFLAGSLGTAFGSRKSGASWAGTLGGIVGGLSGALVGVLFFGIGALFGLLLGAAGGVFLGEHFRQERERDGSGEATMPVGAHDWQRTFRAAAGVLSGYLFSALVQAIFGFFSIVVFVLALVY